MFRRSIKNQDSKDSSEKYANVSSSRGSAWAYGSAGSIDDVKNDKGFDLLGNSHPRQDDHGMAGPSFRTGPSLSRRSHAVWPESYDSEDDFD